MMKFCTQEWRRILLLVIAALWIGIFPIWRDWVTADPLDIPISLMPAEKIEKSITLVLPECYELRLEFDRSLPFKQIETLLGSMRHARKGEKLPRGVHVPIHWTLSTAEKGEVVTSGEVDSVGTSAWSIDKVYCRLGYVKAPPGKYIFRAEVIHSVPELAHIRTRIGIYLNAKSSCTWQTGLAWEGSFGIYFVAWPIAIYAAFRLLLAGLILWSSKSTA